VEAFGIGNHVDLDDLPALDRELSALNSRPRGAMTTPTGRSFWGRAFLFQTPYLKLWDWRPLRGRELFRLLLRSILEILAIRQIRYD